MFMLYGPGGALIDSRPAPHMEVRCQPRRNAETYRSCLMQEQYEQLKQMVTAAADDVAKAAGGNKAAGTRVRKAMQDIKAAAQDVRKKVLETRSAVSQA